MEKLDVKDKKILYEFDLDSRQSFRSIGRKVGLSKDVVAARVKKLQEKGVLSGFCALIDHTKLGYNYYRFYFSFQDVTSEKKKEIIDYFVKDNHTDSIHSLEGNYDLIVFLFVKNFPDANNFWNKTLQKYGKYFSKKVFSAYCQEDYYGYNFLLDEKDFEKKNQKKIYRFFDSGKTVSVDNLDVQIINLISQNCRRSTVEIAQTLNTSTKVVQNRLHKLRESEIIFGYKININLPALGLYIYKVDIQLNEFDKLQKIIKHVEANPYLVYILKTIGYVDLELVFILNNSYQLHQIMEKLSHEFPGAIKSYKYTSGIKTYKAYGI